ncbi:hypothetical protein PanWU01x14_010990 [Parasponia andersonii]|uniref:Transmembrane protein n=1 Tax=Parasponia andersonii TaxID=3476 RepID=A0A2P5E1F0_PARAD|nr:hypothetical protein PanWU01x14_010990 [Parasponia andersonii]
MNGANSGIAGHYDEKVKKVCRFGVKVILDLCGACCVVYFIVEAAKKMKCPDRNDEKHPGQQAHSSSSWHTPTKRDWEVFVGLLLCFVLFFLLALHLIANCLVFINDIVPSHHKLESLDSNNNTHVTREFP